LQELKGAGLIDTCIGNVRTNAPEAQSSLAPRFSVGFGAGFAAKPRRGGTKERVIDKHLPFMRLPVQRS